ncbi:MAG: nitrilase-related carbon-nitrogen hydrolase [Candidatus Thorarchaeota archaeon]|jgi:predicted amidohydrolase
MVKLGIAQMHPQVGEMEKNLKHLEEILREASSQQVDVLVLPELANSGYAFESKDEATQCAEDIPSGPFSKKLIDWSTKKKLVVAGICELSENKLYNSAGIFGNGNHIGTYRKIHLFNKEKKWFNAGEEEPPVIVHEGHRFGIMVCWDWAFPEVARILSLKGAQVILHPANLVLAYCQDAMRTRSIENGIFTATANRVGLERKLEFSGKSQVTDNRSKVLLFLPENEVMVGTVDMKLQEADEKNLTKRNHLLQDRKPELYKMLTESS